MFKSLLQQAALQARTFIVIDAVDRLRADDGLRAAQLDWLPRHTGVKLLVSAAPTALAHAALVKRSARLLEIGALELTARQVCVLCGENCLGFDALFGCGAAHRFGVAGAAQQTSRRHGT